MCHTPVLLHRSLYLPEFESRYYGVAAGFLPCCWSPSIALDIDQDVGPIDFNEDAACFINECGLLTIDMSETHTSHSCDQSEPLLPQLLSISFGIQPANWITTGWKMLSSPYAIHKLRPDDILDLPSFADYIDRLFAEFRTN